MDVEKRRNGVNNVFFYFEFCFMKKGEMAEWFKAADCKSVEVSHRRFESCSLQKNDFLF